MTDSNFEYRYRITRNGEPVGWAEAEWHGAAVWSIEHSDFLDPGEPRTIDRLDAALYAAGFELVPEE
jgi:L-alanine-DL-glutamate epimerase-like enolase superfamily enzyme